jgi:hypothetical protein
MLKSLAFVAIELLQYYEINQEKYKFRTRATQLECYDIRNYFLSTKEETKLEEQIPDTYDWRKDHELNILEEWSGQPWIHNLYLSDKSTIKNLNQMIPNEKSKPKILKLLRKRIRIRKRWNAIEEYQQVRKELTDELKWFEKTPRLNTWRRLVERKFEEDNFVTEALHEFLKMEEHDTSGYVSHTTRNEFIKIAQKEKVFEIKVAKEKNTKWWHYNSTRSERGNMELCGKRK